MSAFAALEGFDGDADIVHEKRKQAAEAEQRRRREAEQASLNFEALKAKTMAGGSNWADDSDEENEFFNSRPVRHTAVPCTLHRMRTGTPQSLHALRSEANRQRAQALARGEGEALTADATS